MPSAQPSLFEADRSPGPAGFEYRPALITRAQEQALGKRIAETPLLAFEFQGFTGRRRVCSFGWRYDFNTASFERVAPIPDWLLEVRTAAAAFGGLEPDALEQVLVTEYPPGAGIGWHRDRPVFEQVVGLSLHSQCMLRFRRRREGGFERASAPLEPRSAYLLTGEARRDWEHSIVAGDQLRRSVTFRSLRVQAGARPTKVRMAP